MGREMLSDVLGVLGLIIGVVSFVFAIYQGTEKRKLEKYIRSQNWHLYSKANNANGSLQLAIEKLKVARSQGDFDEVIEWLSKADAFNQDVFKDIVRQIQLAEPKFGESEIAEWVNTGKISEYHAKELFRKISV